MFVQRPAQISQARVIRRLQGQIETIRMCVQTDVEISLWASWGLKLHATQRICECLCNTHIDKLPDKLMAPWKIDDPVVLGTPREDGRIFS